MKKHLKEMQQYAEDYQYVDNPWELWEAALNDGTFRSLKIHPSWSNFYEYRRKNLSGKQISEGFIPWTDGANPVGQSVVEYILRDRYTNTKPANQLIWRQTNSSDDIVGYRVIQEVDPYARFKQVLKDGGEVAKLDWLETDHQIVPNDHVFSGDPSNYKVVQKEPLTKADFYPGRYIKKKGSEEWLEVKKADNYAVTTDSYFTAYRYLMEEYEIWNPDSKEWEPCCNKKLV